MQVESSHTPILLACLCALSTLSGQEQKAPATEPLFPLKPVLLIDDFNPH